MKFWREDSGVKDFEEIMSRLAGSHSPAYRQNVYHQLLPGDRAVVWPFNALGGPDRNKDD